MRAKSKQFTNLDFMRSVAVLLVAGSHLLIYTGYRAFGAWFGISGVCMFFVHTCLVLMWSLERDSDVGRFYLRRVFRIYPLWLVVLCLTVITQLPMSPFYAPQFRFYHATDRELLANVLLGFDLKFGANVVGASWTLPIEVQMYLFLPCLFFFARQLKRLWPLLLLDLFIVFYGYAYHWRGTGLLVCIPWFLPGIVAYVLWKKQSSSGLPAWLFPVFLLVLVTVDHRFGTFENCWLFCLLLGLAIPLFRDMVARPVIVASHYVARYSYGIYLSHISAIGVSVYMLRAHSMALRTAVFSTMFIALPVVFYHGVEEPMIRLGARLARKIGRGGSSRVSDTDLELEMAP